MNSYNAPSTKPLYRGTQVVWYVLGAIEILLAFRLALKLLAANPGAGFSSFVYNLSYPFILPFQSVFGVTRLEGSAFEWTTLLAMFVYWVLAMAIVKLFLMGRAVSTPEAAAKLDRQETV